MSRKELFDILYKIAEKEFDRISFVKGSFKSGCCKVRQEKNIFLNKNSNLDSNLRILVNALTESGCNIDQFTPEVTQAIYRYVEIELSAK